MEKVRSVVLGIGMVVGALAVFMGIGAVDMMLTRDTRCIIPTSVQTGERWTYTLSDGSTLTFWTERGASGGGGIGRKAGE